MNPKELSKELLKHANNSEKELLFLVKGLSKLRHFKTASPDSRSMQTRIERVLKEIRSISQSIQYLADNDIEGEIVKLARKYDISAVDLRAIVAKKDIQFDDIEQAARILKHHAKKEKDTKST
jgi:hypothetical protein